MPTEFTPISALIGGGLIGLAATLLLGSLGRIAGISGVLNAAVEQREGRGWRAAFLVGLVAAAGLWFAIAGAVPRTDFPLPWLVVGGLLVGAALRIAVEAGTASCVWWRPAAAVDTRRALLGLARALFYLGVPIWLVLRVLSG